MIKTKSLAISLLLLFFTVQNPLYGFVEALAEVVADVIVLAAGIAANATKNDGSRPGFSRPTDSNVTRAGNAIQLTNQASGARHPGAVCPDANAVFTQHFQNLSPIDQVNALVRATPLNDSAVGRTTFQNARQMAILLDKQFQDTKKKQQYFEKNRESIRNYNPHTGFYVEPININYSQKSTQGPLIVGGQPAFHSYTYGSGMGWIQVVDDQFVLEASGAYTHTNVHWSQEFGNLAMSSIYFAPFFGWFNDRAFADFLVMGAINFNKKDRKIAYPGFERHAKSWYRSYTLLLRPNAGVRFEPIRTFWLQPEAALDFFTGFIMGAQEAGSGSLDLQLKARNVYFLQPTVNLRFVKEFCSKKFYYAPSIYLGWLINIPLNYDVIRSRYHRIDTGKALYFDVVGYTKTVNQMVIGAEFYALNLDQLLITANFEADLFDRANVFTTRLKCQWLF